MRVIIKVERPILPHPDHTRDGEPNVVLSLDLGADVHLANRISRFRSLLASVSHSSYAKWSRLRAM